MLEKMRRVDNPLTTIAIFAALAEVAGAVVLPLVSAPVQSTFIWFVMGFPILLVLLFFATLNFNPTVLYAPSDFRDERNFMQAITTRQRMQREIESLSAQVDAARLELQPSGQSDVADNSSERLDELSQKLDAISRGLSSVKASADDIMFDVALTALPRSELQANIITYLASADGPAAADEIAASVGIGGPALGRALDKLTQRGLVVVEEVGGETRYSVVGIIKQAGRVPA